MIWTLNLRNSNVSVFLLTLLIQWDIRTCRKASIRKAWNRKKTIFWGFLGKSLLRIKVQPSARLIKFSLCTSLTINLTRSKVRCSRIIYNVAEAYYCTKNGKVKGVFTLTEHLILFNPIKCTENDKLVNLHMLNTIGQRIATVSSHSGHRRYRILPKDQNWEFFSLVHPWSWYQEILQIWLFHSDESFNSQWYHTQNSYEATF